MRPIVPPTVRRPPNRAQIELLGDRDWPQLAPDFAALGQVLCITHQRKEARELIEELDRLAPRRPGDSWELSRASEVAPSAGA